MGETFRVAVVQEPPVLLNRAATMDRTIERLRTLAADGVRLAVFPEAYLPGYPDWTWRLRPEGPDRKIADDLHAQLLDQAVDLESDDLAPLQQAAAETGTTVVIGVVEREASFGRSTLYCSMVTIGPDGAILNRHRKLVPTNPERMVWGQGDGVGLDVVDTPVGRVGGLICWENYMPLARFALYAQGPDIWVAPNWDDGDAWIATMQHIAVEGRCWVLGAGYAQRVADIPADFPHRASIYPDPDAWLNPGDSVIVAPGGRIVAGPMHRAMGVLVADVDPAAAAAARRTLDVTGHYGRPDVFRLEVDRTRQRPADLDAELGRRS
jgi:nitrilase